MHVESSVGSKGELFLPKQLRDTLGLKPGDKIFFEISDDKTLVVRKVPDLLELLNLPPIGEIITTEFIEGELDTLQAKQITNTRDDEEP
jgi:AbrB family looped-hinge helix DNA binding protein